MTPIRRSLLPRPALAGRVLLIALLATTGLATLTPALSAAQLDLRPTTAADLPEPGLEIQEDGLHLSLDQAITIALERNLGLVIERYNWIQSHHGVLQSLGIYDLSLFGSASYTDTTQPTVEVTEGVPIIQSTSEVYQLGLSQLVPSGGVAELTTSASTIETNSENVFFNPQYRGNTTLSFTQPLLRNFGLLATERNIRVSRLRAAESREAVEQRVSSTIQEVEQAYWNLVESQNQLLVAQEALSLARTLHEQNQVRVEVGTLAPLELVQSEAGIASREEEIIRAEGAIGDAGDRLRQLLNLDQGALWDLAIVPTTDPASERITIELGQAIQTALDERPEIAAELTVLDSLKIDKEYYRAQVRPVLDLVLTYNLAGLAGDSAEFINPQTGELVPAVDRNLGDAFQQIYDADFDQWRVQLQFSYPLQNRQRREQKLIADLAVEQELARLAELRTQIITEVRTAARAVETAAKQIESARVSRELEERNLDAERKRYENGMSSSFRVLQIQEDLTQARSREVSAITNYRTALAGYYRSIGLLLEQKGVEIDQDAIPKGSRFGFGFGGGARE